MNERLLLEMATTLGHRLAMAGAETYRVEESIALVLRAYGLEADAFAIPNCLTVSIITAEGNPMTRMRRIGAHGNDLDAVAQYNRLSRRLVAEHPDPEIAMAWLAETEAGMRRYPTAVTAGGYFLGSFGFAIIFGATLLDALCAGLCGLMIMAIDRFMEQIQAAPFFRVITAAFCASLAAYIVHCLGLIHNSDAAIIGTLMILVPGLLFTNAMRDVMYGDTNSGLNRLIQVLLIAVSIALGTAAALWITARIFGEPTGTGLVVHNFWMLNLGCLIGCVGFSLQFNIHGRGILLCGLGGVLVWSTYLLVTGAGGDIIPANFIGGLVGALYAELMARIRKRPAISYLVIAIFPLIPGAGVYYTMSYAVHGSMELFASRGFETAAIAGAIALGILLVSTAFRILRIWLRRERDRFRRC